MKFFSTIMTQAIIRTIYILSDVKLPIGQSLLNIKAVISGINFLLTKQITSVNSLKSKLKLTLPTFHN